VRNPLDLGFDASPQLYADVLGILGKDPGIANVMVMYTPTLLEDTLHIADSVLKAVKRQRLNVFTCWLGHATVLDAREAFYEEGLPTFFSGEGDPGLHAFREAPAQSAVARGDAGILAGA